MISYQYEAVDRSGKRMKGAIQAPNLSAAEAKLDAQRLTPLYVVEGGSELTVENLSQQQFRFYKRTKASPDEIIDILRSLAVMIKSGVNLIESLDTISQHATSEPAKQVAAQLRQSILDGQSIDLAMRNIPDAFPDVVCEMLAVADEGGNLAKSIYGAIHFMEQQQKTKTSIKSALVYPAVLMSVSIVTLLLFMIVILPTFGKTFEGLNVKLPAITQILLSTGEFLKSNITSLIIGLVMAVIGAKYALRLPKVKAFVNTATYRIPMFGKVLQELALARSVQTFGSLLETNIPVMMAIQFAGRVAGYHPLTQAYSAVESRVENGDTIADSMAKTKAFPAMTVQLVSVGEKSGQLAPLLITAGEQSQESAERKMKAVLSLLEPMFILVMGAIVGALVLSILMPLFSLNQSIK
ncbi:hypothetical protein C0431_01075 [bacterium]|nr:hypothetical protein [bacterium]